MKTRILFLLTVCLMAVTTAFGQSRTVKGQVVSAADSEPLFGVAIVEKGTNNGVISDQDGKFSIQVKNDAVLTVSCVGFIGQSVKATSSNVTIRLQEDVKSLDDLVVIGYGVQKKSDLTGAVSSVSADDIKGLSTTDAKKGAPRGFSERQLCIVGNLCRFASSRFDYFTTIFLPFLM